MVEPQTRADERAGPVEESPDELVPLPSQPADVPWPTEEWPRGEVPSAVAAPLERLIEEAFDDEGPLARTSAVVIVHRGRLVFERYAGTRPEWEGPDTPVDADTTLISGSMAKSILHAAVGICVRDGLLRVDEAPGVPGWTDDLRSRITLDDLLCMRDGLDFVEDYVDGDVSSVLAMLGEHQDDVAGYAASLPSRHPPGEVFNYSSGTSNIVSAVLRRRLGGRADYERLLHAEIAEPIGMSSIEFQFDEAGTWVGSSYAFATARDYARFGLLYLRDGVWDGTRLLPEGWVDHGRRVRSYDPEEDRWYGAHWWCDRDGRGTFRAAGYEGQSIVASPALDLVLVRLGKTPEEHSPDLQRWRDEVVEAFDTTQGER